MTPVQRRESLALFLASSLRQLGRPIEGAQALAGAILAKVNVGTLFGTNGDTLDKVAAGEAMMAQLAEQGAPKGDAPTEAKPRTYDSTHAEILALVVARLKADGQPTRDASAIAHAVIGMEHPSALIDTNGQLEKVLVLTRFEEIAERLKPTPAATPADTIKAPVELGPDSEHCGYATAQLFLAAVPDARARLKAINLRDYMREQARTEEKRKRDAAVELAAMPEGFQDMSPEFRNEWANEREAARKKSAAA
jgi:hypothetical protein